MSIYTNAIDYLTEHGWCRHKRQDEMGRVCLGGAVELGNPGMDYPDKCRWVTHLNGVVGARTGVQGFAHWNDRHARDLAQVIEMLEAADADLTARKDADRLAREEEADRQARKRLATYVQFKVDWAEVDNWKWTAPATDLVGWDETITLVMSLPRRLPELVGASA